MMLQQFQYLKKTHQLGTHLITASFSTTASAHPTPADALYVCKPHHLCPRNLKTFPLSPPTPLKLAFPNDRNMLLEAVGGLADGNSEQQRSQTAPCSTELQSSLFTIFALVSLGHMEEEAETGGTAIPKPFFSRNFRNFSSFDHMQVQLYWE